MIKQEKKKILLMKLHWIELLQIMVFIYEQELTVRAKEPRQSPAEQGPQGLDNPGFHRWLRHLNAMIDYEHQMYNQWPMWVEEQLQKDMGFFGKTTR